MRYLLTKTDKAAVERLLQALSRRRAVTTRELNENRMARLMLTKLTKLKTTGNELDKAT